MRIGVEAGPVSARRSASPGWVAGRASPIPAAAGRFPPAAPGHRRHGRCRPSGSRRCRARGHGGRTCLPSGRCPPSAWRFTSAGMVWSTAGCCRPRGPAASMKVGPHGGWLTVAIPGPGGATAAHECPRGRGTRRLAAGRRTPRSAPRRHQRRPAPAPAEGYGRRSSLRAGCWQITRGLPNADSGLGILAPCPLSVCCIRARWARRSAPPCAGPGSRCYRSSRPWPATRRRTRAGDLTDAGTLPALVARSQAVMSVCPPHPAELYRRLTSLKEVEGDPPLDEVLRRVRGPSVE
jgi:hypothetical protein